jgi:hypothetical protein
MHAPAAQLRMAGQPSAPTRGHDAAYSWSPSQLVCLSAATAVARVYNACTYVLALIHPAAFGGDVCRRLMTDV